MARKVSNGRSVRVTVPAGHGPVEGGKFYRIAGFFGLALKDAAEGEQVVLVTEQAEYETSQVQTADAFNVGDLVYFDDATKLLTTQATGQPVGRVTQAKDANNVIWFVMGPQV